MRHGTIYSTPDMKELSAAVLSAEGTAFFNCSSAGARV